MGLVGRGGIVSCSADCMAAQHAQAGVTAGSNLTLRLALLSCVLLHCVLPLLSHHFDASLLHDLVPPCAVQEPGASREQPWPAWLASTKIRTPTAGERLAVSVSSTAGVEWTGRCGLAPTASPASRWLAPVFVLGAAGLLSRLALDTGLKLAPALAKLPAAAAQQTLVPYPAGCFAALDMAAERGSVVSAVL